MHQHNGLTPVRRVDRVVHGFIAAALALPGAPAIAQTPAGPAATVRLASWNLGWHVSVDQLPEWIAACNRTYRRSSVRGHWELASGSEGTVGWQVTEGRARLQGVDLARMPPCSVYRDGRRNGVAVTQAAWVKRNQQIQQILARLDADILAFQEVSGETAVREALGPLSTQYHVCSFAGPYKVQRLAFAWRKSLGAATEACQVVHPMSLPHLPVDDQVRPGLTMALSIRGKPLRLMNVHLKSSCVSALEKGKLDTDDPTSPCTILQAQVPPLESAFEALGRGGVDFIVLGDFNRNLWHEANELPGAESVRSDGSKSLSAPMPAGVRTRNLWKELNDGEPAHSRAALLALECEGPGQSRELCAQAKRTVLDRASLRTLGSADLMGCRNPVGLDQVVVSQALAPMVRSALKMPIGKFGGTLSARPPQFPDPVLAVSDHCPMQVTFAWPG